MLMRERHTYSIFGVGVFTLLLQGCSTSENGGITSATLFSKDTTEIRYEVDYMPTAEPFVGQLQSGDPIWHFLRNNVRALFNSQKTITVPTTLGEMEQIPAGKEAGYTQNEIFALADLHRNNAQLDHGIASFYILYVDGFFQDARGLNKTVLGVSFGETGIIAIFKPAVTALSFSKENLGKFVEQSVLIHESGHGMGLVNNGLALTSEHHDADHGAHCTNEQCVMFYLNEGVSDLIEFLSRGNPSTETLIFGNECIADAIATLQT